MGTPDFAVPALKALIENNYTIVGVITAPDKGWGLFKCIEGPESKSSDRSGVQNAAKSSLANARIRDL